MANDPSSIVDEFDLDAGAQQKFIPKSGLDFQRLIRVLVRNLYWIVFTALVGLGLAYTWLKYQVPTYSVESTIGFGADPNTSAAAQILRNAGLENETVYLLNNEIAVLKSFDIVGKVVDSLALDVSLTSEGTIRSLPVHRSHLPIKFQLDSNSTANPGQIFHFTIQKTGINVQDERLGRTVFVPYRQQTKLPNGENILVEPLSNKGYIGKEYKMVIGGRSRTVNRLIDQLSITTVRGTSNLLLLSLPTTVPANAQEFMRVLMFFYEKASADFKNQAILKSKEFLNGRIDSVERELKAQEAAIANFQVINRVLEPNNLASYNLNQLNGLDGQRTQALVQVDLVNALERSIDRAGSPGDIVANPFGVSDPIVSGLISQYNALVLSKRRIFETGTPLDPTLPEINAQLDELVKAIKRNFANIRTQASILANSNNRQEQTFVDRFSSLPLKQQQLTDMRRQLSIKEAIYQGLLQKREDFSLQLISNSGPEARIISEPRNTGQVTPDNVLAYALGGGLGFGIPLLIVLGTAFFNRRLETRKEVELLSDVPIVGEINNTVQDKQAIQVRPGNRDLLAEQYRALRSNLMFMGLEDRKQQAGGKTILITSYMRDEGKSFTTLNLASILAQTGKRTVVLEFDLRKPKISAKLHKKQPIGISQYLVNPQLQLADITVLAEESIPSLFLVGTGPLAPNPAELLHHPRMDEMFAQLRREYDYIVIDSAPVGLVSDTLALANYADITLYILRHKYSEKRTISEADRLQFEGKMKNVGLVINGIKAGGFNQSYYYYYGGKYQYGYD